MPAVFAGAAKVTLACCGPGVATPMVGAPGGVAAITLTTGADAGPTPIALLAVTEQEYAMLMTSEDTVRGDAPPVLLRVVWPGALQIAV